MKKGLGVFAVVLCCIFLLGLFLVLSGDRSNSGAGYETPPFPSEIEKQLFESADNIDSVDAIDNINEADIALGEGEIRLRKGWNMVAFSFENSKEAGNKAVTLNKGWNLVGFSAPTKEMPKTMEMSKGIHSKASFYDSEKGSYQLASLSGGELEENKGYWVYSDSAEAVELTLEGVGGAAMGVTKPVDELVFRNVATEAESEGLPLGVLIQKWDSENRRFEYVIDGEVNSWEGYFISSPNDKYVIVG